MLTTRRQQVLEALVREYITYAVPVGSRTLVERYGFDVSPATVRNDLSALEEVGYLVSPHTSAGRIPTDSGYRAYVDGLMCDENASFDDLGARNAIQNVGELDDLVRETCVALNRITNCLAIVLAPGSEQFILQRISLVSLAPTRGLVVLVTKDGRVLDGHIDFVSPTTSDELRQLEDSLNAFFVGQCADDLLMNLTANMELQQSQTCRSVLRVITSLVHGDDTQRIHHLGFSALLAQPEFRDAQRAAPLIALLEDGLALLSTLINLPQVGSRAPIVSIGCENASDALHDASIVAGKYCTGTTQGLIAVVGPTRMDYRKAIQAVGSASQVFEELL